MIQQTSKKQGNRVEGRYQAFSLYKRLFNYTKVYPLAIAGSLLGYLIFALTTPATTWWLGFTVDAINSENYEELRILSPVLCLVIVVTRGVGGFMGSYSLAVIANNVIHRLRCVLMDHLITLPVNYFDHNPSGKLVSKFTYDITQVTGAASNAIAVIVREGFTVVGLLAYLFYIDWQLTLTFILIAPFVAKIVGVASKRFRRYSSQMQDSMADVTQITNESIKGHRVVRSFNAQRFIYNKLYRASERNRIQNMKMAITRSASTPLVQLVVTIAIAWLVWLAMSPEFFSGKSPGDFVAFLGAAGLLAKPIRQLTQINSVVQRGLSASHSVFSLLDEDSEKDIGVYKVKRAVGKIEFKDVNFSYNKQRTALSSINFDVRPGNTIALVGKSGSGKSSIVNLLTRFYEHQSGQILLDGVDLKAYELESLRHQIALVTQQVVLFNGTIRENIAYGLEGVTDEEIESAATSAYAMEFIDDLPQGLDTEVGDDANLLSGGQRQRIAIARALLKNAPILILDEATSALDSESEQYIQEALLHLIKGRTTFVIAHRLSTVENADLILVLEKGRIIESGTHPELISMRKTYYQLHTRDFLADGFGVTK